jgi:hypothetical protein
VSIPLTKSEENLLTKFEENITKNDVSMPYNVNTKSEEKQK